MVIPTTLSLRGLKCICKDQYLLRDGNVRLYVRTSSNFSAWKRKPGESKTVPVRIRKYSILRWAERAGRMTDTINSY
jgi:hypothetical protein